MCRGGGASVSVLDMDADAGGTGLEMFDDRPRGIARVDELGLCRTRGELEAKDGEELFGEEDEATVGEGSRRCAVAKELPVASAESVVLWRGGGGGASLASKLEPPVPVEAAELRELGLLGSPGGSTRESLLMLALPIRLFRSSDEAAVVILRGGSEGAAATREEAAQDSICIGCCGPGLAGIWGAPASGRSASIS